MELHTHLGAPQGPVSGAALWAVLLVVFALWMHKVFLQGVLCSGGASVLPERRPQAVKKLSLRGTHRDRVYGDAPGPESVRNYFYLQSRRCQFKGSGWFTFNCTLIVGSKFGGHDPSVGLTAGRVGVYMCRDHLGHLF